MGFDPIEYPALLPAALCLLLLRSLLDNPLEPPLLEAPPQSPTADRDDCQRDRDSPVDPKVLRYVTILTEPPIEHVHAQKRL